MTILKQRLSAKNLRDAVFVHEKTSGYNENVSGRKQWSEKERAEIIRELTKRYGLRCWYCGVRFEDRVHLRINLDHIVAVSQGGTNDLTNLALACGYCNAHKFYYPVERFLDWLAYIRTGDFDCPIAKQFVHQLEPRTRDILSKGWW